MGALVLTDFNFEIGLSSSPVDLSDHVMSITLNTEVDLQEDSAMGNTDNYRTRLAGMKDWSVDVTFKQDFDATKVDVTLFAILGVSGTFSGRATSSARSSTNPEYEGECLLESYPPFGNAIGELATVIARFVGNGQLQRLV